MSAEATAWVWRNSPFTGADLLVHLAIADVVNDMHGNEFWMAAPALATKARVSRSQVFATLSEMVGRGFLQVVESGQRQGKPTRYLFRSPESGRGSPTFGRPPVQSVDAELKKNNSKEQTKGSPDSGRVASLADLADSECEKCYGHGFTRDDRGGFHKECSCAKSPNVTSIETRRSQAEPKTGSPNAAGRSPSRAAKINKVPM